MSTNNYFALTFHFRLINFTSIHHIWWLPSRFLTVIDTALWNVTNLRESQPCMDLNLQHMHVESFALSVECGTSFLLFWHDIMAVVLYQLFDICRLIYVTVVLFSTARNKVTRTMPERTVWVQVDADRPQLVQFLLQPRNRKGKQLKQWIKHSKLTLSLLNFSKDLPIFPFGQFHLSYVEVVVIN